ncbi:MAG: hypothetical protein WBZ36_18660 [Candidatus Nitrosopolaris sp.]
MSELREIDKETRRARGAMLYKECRSCQDIRKILDENRVLLDQSIIDRIREHFIELHGDRAEDK